MIETLKRGGRRPARTNCRNCNDVDLYPRQSLCRRCFAQWIKEKYQHKQRQKALLYPKPLDLPDEEWLPINGAKGYMISSHGRIKCLNYKDQQREAIMKLREARYGSYFKIDLDKYNWRPSVHVLVAKHFISNPNNYPMVLHKDNNKQNNHKDNLYWGTASMNRKDYIEHTNGVGLRRVKMKKEKVLAIFFSNESVQNISIEYNVSPSTVWMIKTGYRWSSITGIKNTDKRYS